MQAAARVEEKESIYYRLHSPSNDQPALSTGGGSGNGDKTLKGYPMNIAFVSLAKPQQEMNSKLLWRLIPPTVYRHTMRMMSKIFCVLLGVVLGI